MRAASARARPPVSVSEKAPGKFTVMATFMADGTDMVRLTPAKADHLTLWVENARVGDYVVAIDGKPIATFGLQWSRALVGKTRLTPARRVGSKSELIEVDCFDVGPGNK